MRRSLFRILPAAMLPLAWAAVPVLAAAAPTTETIVMVRHGEKPAAKDDIGQLTCQGQNRALALPSVLLSKYGTPDAIFAAKPKKSSGDGGSYYSLRALATIEPTAIAAARTVMPKYEVDDIAGLQHELLKAKFDASTVFVAWEHKKVEDLAKNLVKASGGDDSVVPKWKSDDFDSIYLVRIQRDGSNTSVSFSTDAEHLDGQPTTCAGAPAG
jgi:hypothetical protein